MHQRFPTLRSAAAIQTRAGVIEPAFASQARQLLRASAWNRLCAAALSVAMTLALAEANAWYGLPPGTTTHLASRAVIPPATPGRVQTPVAQAGSAPHRSVMAVRGDAWVGSYPGTGTTARA